MTDFSIKTALITGASRGIGEAAARHLASLGAHVVLSARNTDALEAIVADIEADGGLASAITTDVTDYGDMTAAVEHAVSVGGRLDLLVNNAGLIDPITRLADSDPEAWIRVVDVNYKGVYHGLRAALPGMLAAGGGTIVNISSGAATNALEGWSHYCSSKAAVLSLTRCVHREYADQGIRVLGLSPGMVATDMQVSIRGSGINPVSQTDPDSHIPPDWVARAVAWLCTPAADEHRGSDFSMKTAEGRAALGLPAPD